MKIRVLEDIVSSRIAAGEVVERPASALRELIDNAIDAGSTKITVNIAEGGLKEISVSDNGSGIDKEDLPLACARFATSKIKSIDDIFSLHTLGFRGEALASIASCSILTIISKGHSLTVNNGIRGEIKKASETAGTTVLAENLFEKLPARLEFLKRSTSEYKECKKVLIEKALGFENTEFILLKDGVLDLTLRPSTKKERVLEVLSYEKNFVPADTMEMNYSDKDISLYAVSSLPSLYKRDRSGVKIFINNRIVDNFALVKVITNAYSAALPGGVFPYFYLYITEEPELVDFNIHPAKRECRLRNQSFVFSAITKMIRDSLMKRARSGKSLSSDSIISGAEPLHSKSSDSEKYLLPDSDFTEYIKTAMPENGNPAIDLGTASACNETGNYLEGYAPHNSSIGAAIGDYTSSIATGDFSSDSEGSVKKNNKPRTETFKYSPSHSSVTHNFANDAQFSEGWLARAKEILTGNKPLSGANFQNTFTQNESQTDIIPQTDDSQNIALDRESTPLRDSADKAAPQEGSFRQKHTPASAGTPDDNESKSRKYTYIGQVFNTFLVAEVNNEILFIDQHAAHERILYNEITANPDSQNLAVPYSFETDNSVDEFLLENSFIYADLGVTLARAEPKLWEIYTVPAWCNKAEADIAEFISKNTGDLEEARKGLFAVIACHAAIKAGDALDRLTATELLDKVFKLDALVCPHGRSFTYSISKDELYRKVGRIL